MATTQELSEQSPARESSRRSFMGYAVTAAIGGIVGGAIGSFGRDSYNKPTGPVRIEDSGIKFMYHHMTKDQYAQKLKNNQLFSEKIWRQKVRGSHLWNMDHENHVEFMEIQVMAVSPNPRDDYLGIRGLPERPEIDIYAQGNYILRNGIPSDVSNTAYDKILKKGQPTTFDITYQLNGKNYPTIMERTFLKENELFRSIIKDITENESQNTRTSTEEGEKYPSKITHTSNGVEYVVHEPNLLCKESQDHFERNWDLILREKEWFKNQH